jgi:biotin operon repressor
MKAKLTYAAVLFLVTGIMMWSQSSTTKKTGPSQSKAAPADWKAIDDSMGRSGQEQPDGARKYGMPRKDLSVTVGGVQVKPGLALGSWAAFNNPGKSAMVMGDLVLTEDEVAPVMQKLHAGGLEVTALHNHLLHEIPRVMYMHIHGKGDAATLAKVLHDALAETRTPGPDSGAQPSQQQDIGINTQQIEATLGHKGKVNGGIFQVGVPRAEHITDAGMPVPNSMGLATGLNFQPTGDGKAAITGDFVLLGKEVNPVMKALQENGIAVTAVHSHMLEEQPRLFFMHFWANDDAMKLAKGLRAALDKTNSQKGK